MNFYNISQVPSRQQTAQHFHSSLQEPNLENVEAQLLVARQRNYQLARSYFQSKYGSGEVYNQYVEANQLQGLGAPPEQQFDLRRQLQRQAEEIRQRQLRKINQRKGIRGQIQQEDEQETKVVRNKKKNNIWAENKSKDILKQEQKLKETNPIKEQPQFYEINITKEKQGNFISDFKKYLSNKKKGKQQNQLQKSKLDQSLNISQFKNTSDLAQSKFKQNDKPNYEEELVKKILRDIAGRCDTNTKIEKMQLIQYLTANLKILKVLGLSQNQIARFITSQETKDANLLSYNQTLMLVLQALGKSQEVKKLRAKQQFSQIPQGCMLDKELLNLFQETFRGMDRHNDLIIKRIPYISRLTNDPIIKKSLNLPAVFEGEYGRHVSLRRIFERIEIQTLLCSEEEKKARQYISWNQFISYFQSGHKQRAKYDVIVLLQSLKNEQKFGLSHLPDSVFEIINHGIKKSDRGQELLNTIQIINEIKLHREYQIQKFTFIKSVNEDGNSQTFEDVLVKVKDRALKYVSPKQFLQYFSERGKPIEQFQKERNEQQAKNLSAVKVTFIQNNLFQKPDNLDGYDSDPQIYNASKLQQKSSEAMRKSQKQFKRFKATAQSFMQPQERREQQNQANYKQFKLTIPQPFSFQERERQRKANRKQSPSKVYEPKFKAVPVPASVMQVGLFQKMMSEQQKKNQQRKKCSMIMTLANQKPFSFLNRKTNKKTKEERQQFAFKAKPIPWFCSVDLLKKKEEAEILRNERIAKLAQENLAKAKLPPRMQKDFLQKEAKKILQQKQQKRPVSSQPRVKEPPNFDRLHRQFELAMERKRKQNKNTQVCEFKFSTNMKSASKIIPEQSNQQSRIKRVEIPPSMKSNIDVLAQSTAKFTQQVQKRRKQMQEKRREEAKRKKEDEERKRIDQQLKHKVQQAARKNKQNKQKEDNQKRRDELSKQSSTFQQWKKGCVERGRQQPLLIDRVSKRDQKIEKMRRLYDISQTLKKNGIIGKEHDHYFKREELLLLQDYKQLKDKL